MINFTEKMLHNQKMKYRSFGRTNWEVSSVSFGAWAIGADWGAVDDEDSMLALHAALDVGMNLFDTADVYGDGRSERLLARLKKSAVRISTSSPRPGGGTDSIPLHGLARRAGYPLFPEFLLRRFGRHP